MVCTVNLLPNELLSLVFMCVICEGVLDGEEDTLLSIISVCQLWREVAINTPRLWSAMYLTTKNFRSSTQSPSTAGPAVPSPFFIQSYFRWIESRFRRSKDVSLDLFVHIEVEGYADFEDFRFTKELIAIIKPHLHRCRELTWIDEYPHAEGFTMKSGVFPIPGKLERLQFFMLNTGESMGLDGHWNSPLVLFTEKCIAPLRLIDVDGDIQVRLFNDPNPTPTNNNPPLSTPPQIPNLPYLRKLCLLSTLSLEFQSQFSAPNLKHLEIRCPTWLPLAGPVPNNHNAPFPHLQRLLIENPTAAILAAELGKLFTLAEQLEVLTLIEPSGTLVRSALQLLVQVATRYTPPTSDTITNPSQSDDHSLVASPTLTHEPSPESPQTVLVHFPNLSHLFFPEHHLNAFTDLALPSIRELLDELTRLRPSLLFNGRLWRQIDTTLQAGG